MSGIRKAKERVAIFTMEDDDHLWASSTSEYEDLHCFNCNDDSLYHDSYARYHTGKDDLLCLTCYDNLNDKEGYQPVITFH